MKQKKNSSLTELCAELRPGDGVPPHLLRQQERKENHARQQRPDRHQQQYCGEARRCLDAALQDCASLPEGLCVLAVEPLSGGSLLVVAGKPGLVLEEISGIESRLQRCAGRLRAALAGETRRRRTPHLRFRVVPAEG